MSGPPVVLLAFANDEGNHLDNLVRERKTISDALSSFEDNSYIRVHVEDDAGIDDLFGLFDRFSDQVAMFHYGGHADGTALDLEKPGGENEVAHAGGLAKMLGLSEQLQLIFLNGCATQGQVKALLDAGVKAVIATAAPINDAMATDFAGQFYSTLAAGQSIGKAFEAARALIATRYGDAKTIEQFRGFTFGDAGTGAAQQVSTDLTWGIYTQPNGDAVLDWALPTQAANQVIIRGAAFSQDASVPVNNDLIQTAFNAVAPHSPQVEMLLDLQKKTGQADFRSIRQQLIDSFPSPVGEQLRKLFASSTVDEARLRQLVVTYETIIKLFAFAMLSQLWNARVDKPDLAISDDQRASIDSFNTLDANAEAHFDYVALIIAIDQIFSANSVEPFMSECSQLGGALGSGPANDAWRFMDEMRGEIADGKVDASEVESFCVQAEKHLGVLLDAMAFIVGYKLATIKTISINKTRHKPAEFHHRQVLLDRVTAGFEDTDEVRASFTDNESVIILKDPSDVTNYLNLTPFVVDQNALTHNQGTKLYFMLNFDAAANAVHYYSIADPTDALTISDALDDAGKAIYLPVRDLVHEYCDGMAK